MPRKKLIYTHLLPYHITARANNKKWFYLPKEEVWSIYVHNINEITKEYGFRCHEFLLMNNHYHMIGSTTTADLGEVFCVFQKSISRMINSKAGQINHVFGGPYKPSLIHSSTYYYHVYKYLYRNPIEANMVNQANDYIYSTFDSNHSLIVQPNTSKPTNGIDCHIPTHINQKLSWINEAYSSEGNLLIQKGLRKTEFKIIYKNQWSKIDLNFK
ncbi:MAG: hypothetical protein HOO06_15750 [Bdellovibrionaceae bacterium]|jgi:putative transposase|nr:hypothetical protein [Pseudobdellovibrionaceae bacterium]